MAVLGAAAVLLALIGGLVVLAGAAGAQSPVVVVVTGGDLDWSVGDSGSMHWWGFGSGVSQDAECASQVMGGPVSAIRFELTFDLVGDSATLTGTLLGSGEWRSDAVDDPAYGQEWGSWSFSGPIVRGWARETEEGWAWGGDADLTLDFAGLRICSIFLDESGAEDYIVAEGNGRRQLTVRFVGGAGAYGEDSGFSLDGASTPGYWEPGEDVWGIALGCNGCDIPVPLPVGPAGPGDSGGVPGGGVTVSSVPQQPATAGESPADEGGEVDWYTLFSPGGAARRAGWSPLGVLILILLLIAAGFAVGQAVVLVLREAHRGAPYPLADAPSRRQAWEMADAARAGQTPIDPGIVPRYRYVMVSQPVQLRLRPSLGARRTGVELTPGEAYRTVAVVRTPQTVVDQWSGNPGQLPEAPEAWIEVDVGGQRGWVPESALSPYPELPATPAPSPPEPPPAPR